MRDNNVVPGAVRRKMFVIQKEKKKKEKLVRIITISFICKEHISV